MMAKKKRRRRRVDEAKPADTPPPPSQTNAPEAAAAASSGLDADEEEGEGVEGVMMPPMPSELGVDAVMTAQVRTCLTGRRLKLGCMTHSSPQEHTGAFARSFCCCIAFLFRGSPGYAHRANLILWVIDTLVWFVYIYPACLPLSRCLCYAPPARRTPEAFFTSHLILPSRTVFGKQSFQGEDMMSPAAFQPKPEVTDLEMAGGGAGLSARDLFDEPSPERKVNKVKLGWVPSLPLP